MSLETKNGFVDSIGFFWRYSVLGQVDGIKSKLDPISVLAVLALLNYKKIGTLIGFKGYLMTTEAPSSVQGVVRCIFGESREDLAVIPTAIEKAATWFHPEIGEDNDYRELFMAAHKGLGKLQQTYREKQSNVTPAAISDWMKSIILYAQQEEQAPDEPELNQTAQKVHDLWTLTEIRQVNSLIAQMDEKQGDVSPDIEVKCADKIEILELYLKQKAVELGSIYEG